MRGRMLGRSKIVERIVSWFIPDTAILGRTEWELARIFVFTHIFGPLIAQPMWIYLYLATPRVSYRLVVMACAICGFWLLPFVLRRTGSIRLSAACSFQLLTAASLFGTYHYGGFSSPFLPWLVVSLMLGLFYLSKQAGFVLAVFAANVAIFLAVVIQTGFPHRIPVAELRVSGWLSLAASMVYMTWMALYYARIIGLRTELELEIERQRATAIELEKARSVAEDASEARTSFFSKMSHELRTPLNAIIGYSDILLEDCQAEPDVATQRVSDITRINAAGRHLLSLVSDVLDINRIEKDVIDVEVTEFTLGSLADDVVATATAMVEKNGNTFRVHCPHRGYRLRTDAKKLRQILLNLLGNAGKFTENGVVRLELRIDFHSHDDQLVAIVSDTGIGIAPEALPRLFTDYEQADPSIFNRFGGTGLGLALSRKLSIVLGGDIAVTSQLRQGTRFTVTVPAHLQSESLTPAPGFSPAGEGAVAT